MIFILEFITILFGITAGISITMLLLTNKSIKFMTKNLQEINKTKTHKKITLMAPNRKLEDLAEELNKTIDNKRQIETDYENKNLELRRSIANISHDLRTPLTSIIGYIQLLDDEKLTEAERKQYTEIVMSRAKALQLLIGGFFDLSRLEAGEYNFELKPVNLQNVLCEQMAAYYNDFIAKGIEPQIDVDDAAPLVIADENAVKRIFSNLIQNVLKHGSGLIKVGLKQSKNYIITSFTNNAPDLKNEDVAHLFERFYTADRMRSGRNTGLGLAITKSLAEELGCTIDAELKDKKLSIIIKWKKKNK